jgi:lysophospholipase L1-like esterase
MKNTEIRSIMVLGDSISKGVVYSDEKKRYVFYKEGFINGVSSLLKVPVHNLSKFGSTVKSGMSLLAEKFSALEPDIVLIEYGGNDCDFDWDDVAKRPEADHQPRATLEAYEKSLIKTVSYVKEMGKTPVLMNLPPLNDAAYFDWFTQGSAEKGERILKWLRDKNRIYWWQEQYSCSTEDTARRTDTRLINIRSAFLRAEDYRRFLCKDGIHPNEKGQLLIKEVLRDYIYKNASYLLSAT